MDKFHTTSFGGPNQWVWQHAQWPRFHWDSEVLAVSVREVTGLQGKLLGKVDAMGGNAEVELDALLQNIVQTSAIEGEDLNVESVRSSLAKRLGVSNAGFTNVTSKTEGMAELLLDATQNYDESLSFERLCQWHEYLFPDLKEGGFRLEEIRIGALRGDDVMQVVSGPHEKRTVHFEAPPRKGLEKQVTEFLQWLEASKTETALDPILRAGQAHFWFVTLHPFDDGNGRLARVITDYALAQAEHQAIRFYAMAASIMEKRAGYYSVLERVQKGDLDITVWMQWFLDTLKDALIAALARIDMVLIKSRFWSVHWQDGLNPGQTKVLNRLLDAGPNGFEGGLNATKYKSMAKVSKATATRHIANLLEKGCLVKLKGGGRSTRYDVVWP